MPTTTKVAWGFLPKRTRAVNGQCAWDELQIAAVNRVNITKNLRSSRVKPANLLLNPTALLPQYTYNDRHQVYKRVVRSTRVCNGVSVAVDVTTHETYLGSYPIITWSDGDWAQALRLKLMDQQVSYAESIGEWRESVTALKGGADILRRSWRAAKTIMRSRRKRRTMWRLFKREFSLDESEKSKWVTQDVISMHLAITYGVRPVVGLLEDTIARLNTVSSRAMRVVVTVPGTGYGYTSGPQGGGVKFTGESSSRCIAYVWFKPNAKDFTAGNIFESIWAGLPFSFMLDWFVGIGAYLQSINELTFIDKVTGTVTYKRQGVAIDDTVRVNGVVTPGRYHYRYHTRSVIGSIPMPTKVRFKLPANWDNLVSSMEILTQLRKNR